MLVPRTVYIVVQDSNITAVYASLSQACKAAQALIESTGQNAVVEMHRVHQPPFRRRPANQPGIDISHCD